MGIAAPTCHSLDYTDVVNALRHLLGDDANLDPAAARRRLQALLTRQQPGTLPDVCWPLLDDLWADEARRRNTTPATKLQRLSKTGWASRVSLWRGDITTLEVDAIVNAANAQLTGCYVPFHACVDNAIHTAAGPRLREECGRRMAARGRPEPAGTATATSGGFLRARYVLHTVGPIVRDRDPSRRDAEALGRCYTACLDVGGQLACSVAFPSISTGVFGYPISAAAPLAVATVKAWLENNETIDHVVLVTYSEEDESSYEIAIQEAFDV